MWGPKKVIKMYVECPHCGYVDNNPDLIKNAENPWECKACCMYSTVYTGEYCEVTSVRLGYQRRLPVTYEID